MRGTAIILWVALATTGLATDLMAEPARERNWSIGYRVELLTAGGSPADDMMGSGAYAHYQIGNNYRVEWAFEYVEYDFESPQRYLGFARGATEDVDSRTRCTLISLRVERAWLDAEAAVRPLAFAGLGMGYAVIDDVRGSADNQSFDINAEGGIETVPCAGVGLRYCNRRFTVDGGIKLERHFTDWDLEDRLSGIQGEVGDYTAWGTWIGISVQL
ncbi:MAG: hypothetical protein ABIG44_14940 [Planctomycetota bacterium]